MVYRKITTSNILFPNINVHPVTDVPNSIRSVTVNVLQRWNNQRELVSETTWESLYSAFTWCPFWHSLRPLRLRGTRTITLTGGEWPAQCQHHCQETFREFWGRGRSLVQLPVSLVTRTSDYEDDVSANEIIPEEPAAEQAISNLVLLKSPDIKFETNSSTR